MFGISASGILPPLIVQSAAPSRMRGRLIAINLMATSLFGLAIGPPLTAAVADAFHAGPQAIGYAMALIAAICGPVATVATLMARRRYLLALDDAMTQDDQPTAAHSALVPRNADSVASMKT
jgi:MFS family permease